MSSILPYEIVSTITVNRFEIDSIDIRLFSSANIRVNLFDLAGFRVSTRSVLMEGDDYANWGNDDQYIVSFVMNALGFTPTAPPVEVVTVEEVVVPTVEEVVVPTVEEVVVPTVEPPV
jgi:hypothetical protein